MTAVAGILGAAVILGLGLQEKNAADLAWERFLAAPAEQQSAIVEEVTQRIEQSDEPHLRELLALRDRARAELPVQPAPPPEFYSPDEFAPGQGVHRKFADPTGAAAAEKRALYRPEENAPQFPVRVRYDFGLDVALDSGVPLSPEDALWNHYFLGQVPDADVLLAWLEWKLDWNDKHDALALHFGHCYCDLQASCYADVAIYDALASEEGLDMPDVDVIPFAIKIKKDRSFRSPIPPGSRRTGLYETIKKTFLPYFQHRSFVQEAAWLYLQPEGWIRPEHEGVRRNLLYLIAREAGDVDALLAFFKKARDRSGFMEDTLRLTKTDRTWTHKIDTLAAGRLEARHGVLRAVNSVLREYGLLLDEQADDPSGGH